MTFEALVQHYEETMARARCRAATLDDAAEALAGTSGADPAPGEDGPSDAAPARRRILGDLLADLDR